MTTPRLPGTLSLKQLKVIELLARGKYSQVAIAEEIGLNAKTICTWRRDPAFMQAVVHKSRQYLKEELPEVYSKLAQKSKGGSHNHMKIMLDHLEKLEAATANTKSITFVWKEETNGTS